MTWASKQTGAIADERKNQVGTGDRSERIRTYNYHQGRVSDHRIGLTLYKIDEILQGSLDELIDALSSAEKAEEMAGNSQLKTIFIKDIPDKKEQLLILPEDHLFKLQRICGMAEW